MAFFSDVPKIKYDGPDSTNPLAYRHYNPDELVEGKSMRDHLRFAVCYWHTFVWNGGDPFGGQTFERPWFGETLEHARQKADVAFEMFTLLGVPYYCFHDADVRPEGATFAENTKNLDVDKLYVSKAFVDAGPTMKRTYSKAMGRGSVIRKRSSHVTVVVAEK